MPIALLTFCISLTSFAVTPWEQVLNQGWTPPAESFIYGYSEFTSSYLQGVRPYETYLDSPEKLKKGLPISEFVGSQTFLLRKYEELKYIQPGFSYLATHLLKNMQQLTAGDSPGRGSLRGISQWVMQGNPYWASDFSFSGRLRPIVAFTPLAISRIQENLGRTHPWTVFGGAELNWEEIFWLHSGMKDPEGFFCSLLESAFNEKNCKMQNTGAGILTQHPEWIPTSLKSLIVTKSSHRQLKYLITFEPHSEWKAAWRESFLKKELDVIPHPSTLVFSASPFFEKMAKNNHNPEIRQLPLAMELSQFSTGLAAKGGFYGLRALDISKRSYRFEKTTNQPQTTNPIGLSNNDPMALLLSPDPVLLGVYNKPIARNTQLWGVSGPLAGRWLLDGPKANRQELAELTKLLEADRASGNPSHLHYRNYYPPMEINGQRSVWYRPLVSWIKHNETKATIDATLLGSLQVTQSNGKPVWIPVQLNDWGADEALAELNDKEETTAMNVEKLVQFSKLLRKKIPTDLAASLLNPVSKPGLSYEEWKSETQLPVAAKNLLNLAVSNQKTQTYPTAGTFPKTVTNSFEMEYWKHIVELSDDPRFSHKNNTDCADTDEKKKDIHCSRNQLPEVLDYLENYYRNEVGLKEIYLQSFDWRTDFDFYWDGLKQKQHNMIVVIHGTDNHPHDEAIIMGDHYDTAPMADIYEGESYADGKNVPELKGHRHAAKGSDDNHSATSALMSAAKILKNMKLDRDVWLVHITGEEFPADGLGSRALIQALVENKPLIPGGNPKIAGVYILDMVGHSTDRDAAQGGKAPAIFQIAPGRGERSAVLAVHGHHATQNWNRLKVAEKWDTKLNRMKEWKRYTPPKNKPVSQYPLPILGKFLDLTLEIRPGWHFRSSLYNTDIQLFSDAGIPSALFMENYDINRTGYHDTMDNLSNIDLDYARGVVSVSIETVALAAGAK